MTQTAQLRNLFDDNNGSVTLGQMMNTYLAASYRQRLTDLKRELFSEGKTIVCYPCRKEGHKSETRWAIERIKRQIDVEGQVLLGI